ncbi:hypothetical protein W822_15230 [Advenella kashmirensis W13003]|uniref:Uncharacterized protein n=1 Tax=Advenella kashmirensis W13003 TaxID=1424334 RepID=V8QR49_9BURK|nr:hypothetical protein [Advenella kashmirensis]ETF02097.1 hypothetical protein W822_15230 [Advenella kashmirensis W13003]
MSDPIHEPGHDHDGHQPADAAHTQQDSIPTGKPPGKSLFSNGGFVIGLIIFGLFTALITWSVSFSAMFFGAIGTLLSVATCFLDHEQLRFARAGRDCKLDDENWAYLVIRAVFGMIFGTAAYVVTFQGVLSDTSWAAVAAVAAFSGFVFDQLLFKRGKNR